MQAAVRATQLLLRNVRMASASADRPPPHAFRARAPFAPQCPRAAVPSHCVSPLERTSASADVLPRRARRCGDACGMRFAHAGARRRQLRRAGDAIVAVRRSTVLCMQARQSSACRGGGHSTRLGLVVVWCSCGVLVHLWPWPHQPVQRPLSSPSSLLSSPLLSRSTLSSHLISSPRARSLVSPLALTLALKTLQQPPPLLPSMVAPAVRTRISPLTAPLLMPSSNRPCHPRSRTCGRARG